VRKSKRWRRRTAFDQNKELIAIATPLVGAAAKLASSQFLEWPEHHLLRDNNTSENGAKADSSLTVAI